MKNYYRYRPTRREARLQRRLVAISQPFECSVLPADGYSDGGEPYTDEEMTLIAAQEAAAAQEAHRECDATRRSWGYHPYTDANRDCITCPLMARCRTAECYVTADEEAALSRSLDASEAAAGSWGEHYIGRGMELDRRPAIYCAED